MIFPFYTIAQIKTNKKPPQQNRQNKLYINYVLLIFVLKLCNIVSLIHNVFLIQPKFKFIIYFFVNIKELF